jgi:hypothetical protein
VRKLEMGKISPVFIHDLYNIFSIFGIIFLDFQYLYHSTTWSKIGTSELGNDSHDMGYYLLGIFSIYLFIDTIWIAVQPKCVLSNPTALIIHHIASFVFLSIPFFEKQFYWHGALNLFVEVNTFFLILRRLVTLDSTLYVLLDRCFLATWIVLRLVVFPIVVVFFSYEYIRFTKECNGNWMNIMILAPILQSILTLLGFKWTYDMVLKMSKRSDSQKGKKLI